MKEKNMAREWSGRASHFGRTEHCWCMIPLCGDGVFNAVVGFPVMAWPSDTHIYIYRLNIFIFERSIMQTLPITRSQTMIRHDTGTEL